MIVTNDVCIQKYVTLALEMFFLVQSVPNHVIMNYVGLLCVVAGLVSKSFN